MRRIGRERRLASPSNTAVIGQPATAPMARRQPVPELPKSSGARGSAKPLTPTPMMRQVCSPVRSRVAPSARMAFAVLMASSPSSMPSTRVSPTVSAPRIRERSEIDLSPGTRTRPAAVRAPVAEEEVAAPEIAEAEFVSLEEADKETEGAKPAAIEGEEDVEVEEEPIDDGAFIVPEEEEEEEDVTDIIGEGRE